LPNRLHRPPSFMQHHYNKNTSDHKLVILL
jgi:hypothetical protein